MDARTTENKHLIEFTLAARCDLEGVRIPLRVITQMCGWQSRGGGSATSALPWRGTTTCLRRTQPRTGATLFLYGAVCQDVTFGYVLRNPR
ncbi:hypothetical protein [Myxococcus sp. CA039A]|uniref:hypothetical protein n=1 Tax=Myxococcus sp. CA039A TaxID=2741737 RepID=UPI00157A4C6C|nr:hypothetical protein [Myxococcus sp. CA039A]